MGKSTTKIKNTTIVNPDSKDLPKELAKQMRRDKVRNGEAITDFDLLQMYLLSGGKQKLRERIKPRYEKIKRAYALILEGYSRHEISSILQTELQVSESESYCIINDCIKLYGDIANVDKHGLRNVQTERLLFVAKKVQEAGDYELFLKYMEVINRVNGLYEQANIQVNMNTIHIPAPVIQGVDKKQLEDSLKINDSPFLELDFEEL